MSTAVSLACEVVIPVLCTFTVLPYIFFIKEEKDVSITDVTTLSIHANALEGPQ